MAQSAKQLLCCSQLEKLIAKPFEKEAELVSLRQSVAALEREIALNIQKKQLAGADGDIKKTPVVQMDEEDQKAPKKKKKLRV